jgi:hypothetical protein
LKIVSQGNVRLTENLGYLVVGNEDAVCFFMDPVDDAYIAASTRSEDDCPVAQLSDGSADGPWTVVEFTEFPGWQFHSGRAGKTIAIALTRHAATSEASAKSPYVLAAQIGCPPAKG